MNRLSTPRLACFAVLALASGLAQAAKPVTIESLLHEMVDREALARFPAPAYVGKQASSYDRDSVSPDDRKSWFANMDRSQFVRIEERNGKKEYVMMDEQGPGAIVHLWATWHGPHGGPFSDGLLRVYIDGDDKPAIEGKASEVIDKGLLTGAPLSEGVSPKTEYPQQGHNLYLPIPYAKHCKVTYSTDVPVDRGAHTGEALYYQINFRTYEQGTEVESFSLDRLNAARPVVDATNQLLASGGREEEDGWYTQAVNAEIAAGSESQPIYMQGPAAIRSLECRIEAQDVEQALRSTVLEISFDGERTVWCPIGEFCGLGYKPRTFQTWYAAATDEGQISCHWVMPFASEAIIKVHNLGAQPVRIVDGKIRQSDWNWDDRSMHFHATWRQLTEADTGAKNGEQAVDVNYVTVTGQGVLVGDTLTVMNGAAAWWGEGDEKIFVDGEKFPSHFGTGTEDYYGYAWCRPEYFTAPFHAQPEGGGNIAGGYSVNDRYRALDAIPFTKSLQFDMELWHWADTKVNYAPATFWYGKPGATANVQPDPATAAKPVARQRTDIVPPFRVPGAIEGESLKVTKVTGGRTEVQSYGFRWSNDAQLWWMDGKVGDALTLEFPVGKAGKQKLSAELTKAADYAVVEISVNDGPPKRFDRYSTGVAHDLVDLGTVDLREGVNTLTVKIVGEHPQAVHRRMFGLDYLMVK